MGLKRIDYWLRDYFSMIEGTKMEEVLRGVGAMQAADPGEATRRVNARIDAWVAWANVTRPSNSYGVQECYDRKAGKRHSDPPE